MKMASARRQAAGGLVAVLAMMTVPALEGSCGPAPRQAPPGPRGGAEPIRWRRVHHETFDAAFVNPPWVEDTYGDASPYHVDAFDEDGAFFTERGGATFTANLARFRSFRTASRYG